MRRGAGSGSRSCPRSCWRLLEKPRDWLFPGDTPAEPVSTDAARQAFAQAARDAGLTRKCTPHTLRHCFATHLLDAGADLVVLQALLGHRAIKSTARYTHVTTRRLRQIVSPLDLLPVVPPGTDRGPQAGEG
jgi:integrase/recombinase XerD